MSTIYDGETDFTQDELIRALLQAQESAEGDETARTTRELMEMLGVSDKKVRRLLRQLIQKGVVEHVYVHRWRINGMFQQADAYRLVKQESKDETDDAAA
jgi:DNA-binding GntR family transcriptional regulator